MTSSVKKQKDLSEQLAALGARLAAIEEKLDQPTNKDVWDKLSTIATLISLVLLGLIGTLGSMWYRKATLLEQDQNRQVQAIGELQALVEDLVSKEPLKSAFAREAFDRAGWGEFATSIVSEVTAKSGLEISPEELPVLQELAFELGRLAGRQLFRYGVEGFSELPKDVRAEIREEFSKMASSATGEEISLEQCEARSVMKLFECFFQEYIEN